MKAATSSRVKIRFRDELSSISPFRPPRANSPIRGHDGALLFPPTPSLTLFTYSALSRLIYFGHAKYPANRESDIIRFPGVLIVNENSRSRRLSKAIRIYIYIFPVMKKLQPHFANYDATWRNHEDPRDLRQVIFINGFFIRAFSRSHDTLAEVSAETLSRSYSECAAPNFFSLTTFTKGIFLEEIPKYFFLVSFPICRYFFSCQSQLAQERREYICRITLMMPIDAIPMKISSGPSATCHRRGEKKRLRGVHAPTLFFIDANSM